MPAGDEFQGFLGRLLGRDPNIVTVSNSNSVAAYLNANVPESLQSCWLLARYDTA